MLIEITRRHMKMGRFKPGKDPMSLAVADATKLPDRCFYVFSKVLTLYTVSGFSFRSFKWPDEAADFIDKYKKVYTLGMKMPKRCSFEMGVTHYYEGCDFDWLKYSVDRILNWEKDYYGEN